jgi:hypothetical protein
MQTARVLAKSPELGQPSGILVTRHPAVSAQEMMKMDPPQRPTHLWVVTQGTGEIYEMNDRGERLKVSKFSQGGLRGVVEANDGKLFVSSSEGHAIYRSTVAGAFEVAFANFSSPAGIGFDDKRSRLLVPLPTEGAIEVYEVKTSPSP